MVNYDMVLRFIFLTAAWSCGEWDGFCLLTRFFPNWELGLIRHWIVGRGNAGSLDFARDDSGVGSVPRPFLLAPCGAWVFFSGVTQDLRPGLFSAAPSGLVRVCESAEQVPSAQ